MPDFFAGKIEREVFKLEIYLDNSATTMAYPECGELVSSVMTKEYGNPSSLHRKGMEAEKIVKTAAKRIADTIKVSDKEIYFLSGGTEGDNLAILGTCASKRGRHIITSAVEHPAVLSTLEYLESKGYVISRIPVLKDGRCDLKSFEKMIRQDTVLVTCMLVNNEIGTIEPIKEMSDILKRRNPSAVFHVDAVQGYGKLKFSAQSLGADIITLSSHKIHGPKGMGALYIKSGLNIRPIIYGGGQQGNIRPGTENVPGIAGFGLAALMSYTDFERKTEKMRTLRERLEQGIVSNIPDVKVNTPERESAPHILNVSFKGAKSEVILHSLENYGIYVSSGSACSSHKKAPSYVLTAIGLDRTLIDGSIRFSLSEFTTKEEIDYTVDKLISTVETVRKVMRK